ncbi:MAG: S41 family peptidase [Kofleriaceae bacterium]|nr:S41 family peptidase [Kofleriaceae bacterium]
MNANWKVSSIASHLGLFLLGIIIATATSAQSAPSGTNANTKRYAALNAFAQALSIMAKSHVDDVNERELIYGGISGMAAQLDPHSVFYSPAQYKRLQQDTQGEFGGVGIELGAGIDGSLHPRITAVIADSPAARAGVIVGDSLIAVDNKETVKNGEALAGAKAWYSRVRGAVGTRAELRVNRKGWQKPRAIVMMRQRVAIPSVFAKRYGAVSYIAIKRFREATVRDLRAALESHLAKKSPRLILDLRGNPGGLLDKGISVADIFLDKGTIVSVESRGSHAALVSRAHTANSYIGFPMVVLVDEGSASSSEIVAAALQDNHRAVVIGATTYGKGSVQTFFDLVDGSGMKLTTSRYLTPEGKTLEGEGVVPDIPVDAFAAEIIGASPNSGSTGADTALMRKELTVIQRESLDADLQLFKSYQYLTANR